MTTKPKCESNGRSHVVAVVKIGTVAHDNGMLVIIFGRGKAEEVWATTLIETMASKLAPPNVFMVLIVRLRRRDKQQTSRSNYSNTEKYSCFQMGLHEIFGAGTHTVKLSKTASR